MSAKTDYVIQILNDEKANLQSAKQLLENKLSSEQNELLSIQNKITDIQNNIGHCDWEITTLDQAIAKIMELDQ